MAVPAEYMETYYPMLVDEYSVRPDSCGAGQFRGGCGIKKVYRFLADGALTYQDDRAATFPYGVAGGRPGAPSKKTLLPPDGIPVALPSEVREVPVVGGDHLPGRPGRHLPLRRRRGWTRRLLEEDPPPRGRYHGRVALEGARRARLRGRPPGLRDRRRRRRRRPARTRPRSRRQGRPLEP